MHISCFFEKVIWDPRGAAQLYVLLTTCFCYEIFDSYYFLASCTKSNAIFFLQIGLCSSWFCAEWTQCSAYLFLPVIQGRNSCLTLFNLEKDSIPFTSVGPGGIAEGHIKGSKKLYHIFRMFATTIFTVLNKFRIKSSGCYISCQIGLLTTIWCMRNFCSGRLRKNLFKKTTLSANWISDWAWLYSILILCFFSKDQATGQRIWTHYHCSFPGFLRPFLQEHVTVSPGAR